MGRDWGEGNSPSRPPLTGSNNSKTHGWAEEKSLFSLSSPISSLLPFRTPGEKARCWCTWSEHHDFLQPLRPKVRRDRQTEGQTEGERQTRSWGPVQVGARGTRRPRVGTVSTSDSSTARDPGAAGPAAAARSASTMHCSAGGHRGGGRSRADACSVRSSFPRQLSVHCCLGSKAFLPLPQRRTDRRGREKR